MSARTAGIVSRIALLALALCLVPTSSEAVRVKDISSVKGIRGNQIIGYGLVVGLNGTGDKQGTEFTVRSLTSVAECSPVPPVRRSSPSRKSCAA